VKISTAKAAKSAKKNRRRTFALLACFAVDIFIVIGVVRHNTCSVNTYREGRQERKEKLCVALRCFATFAVEKFSLLSVPPRHGA